VKDYFDLSMNKQILLFDFDGVIVNTFELCFSITKKFNSDLSHDAYLALFEGNIYDGLKKKNGGIYDKKQENDERGFFEIYTPQLLEIGPVPGMSEIIKELEKDYVLIMLTSTINSPINSYLEKYGLHKYFDKIFGADVHKSKEEKIKMVFQEFNVKPNDCLFITDTLGDMREAEKAGIQVMGVLWGFHPEKTLEKGNPIALARAPADIIFEVNKYFQNKTQNHS